MKFQKLLFSVLISTLFSLDMYPANQKNPFKKKPVRNSNMAGGFSSSESSDSESEPTAKRSTQPSSFLDQFGDEWNTPEALAEAKKIETDLNRRNEARKTAATEIPVTQEDPLLSVAAKHSPAPVLTLAERKALLESSAAAEKKTPSSMHQDPTMLTVKERIALQEAAAKNREEENRIKVWQAQIDRDAAAAKKERERKISTGAAPIRIVPSLARAEEKVLAAEQQTRDDRLKLAKAEANLARTALLNAQKELSQAKATQEPTREETQIERLERQQQEARERGLAQIEHERAVWAAAGQIPPWKKPQHAAPARAEEIDPAQKMQLERIVLVVRGINNTRRRPSPTRTTTFVR